MKINKLIKSLQDGNYHDPDAIQKSIKEYQKELESFSQGKVSLKSIQIDQDEAMAMFPQKKDYEDAFYISLIYQKEDEYGNERRFRSRMIAMCYSGEFPATLRVLIPVDGTSAIDDSYYVYNLMDFESALERCLTSSYSIRRIKQALEK